MPLAVAYFTVTGVALAADNVTVSATVLVPLLPSVTEAAGVIEILGSVVAPSLSAIVPLADAVPTV